jgi:hypothetical protein
MAEFRNLRTIYSTYTLIIKTMAKRKIEVQESDYNKITDFLNSNKIEFINEPQMSFDLKTAIDTSVVWLAVITFFAIIS